MSGSVLTDISFACRSLLKDLPAAEPVRRYLDSRVSSESTQEVFGFGYFPPSEHLGALLSLVPEASLYQTKLRYDWCDYETDSKKRAISTFEHHNLVLPYRDLYGNIVSIVGRTMLPDWEAKLIGIPKYRNTSFRKGNHLFGMYEAKESIIKHDCVVVTEGQFDCIGAYSHGVKNVVALGSASMTMYQLSLILRYTSTIYLFLDNDDAGRNGTDRIIHQFKQYADFRPKSVPSGYKDIFDFLKDNPTMTMQSLTML